MKHEELKDLLSDFRDGELELAAHAEVTAHLEGCDSCRERLDFYARASAALTPPAAPPSAARTEAFARAVVARLDDERAAGPLARLLAWSPWAAPALAVGLAAAVAVVLVPPRASVVDPADALLIAADGGRTYAWIAAPASASRALDWGNK